MRRMRTAASLITMVDRLPTKSRRYGRLKDCVTSRTRMRANVLIAGFLAFLVILHFLT
jgi:hypothetical protein